MRSMIACIFPRAAFGNKVPQLMLEPVDRSDAHVYLSCLNSFAFDFSLRQKLQGQTINLFILEQLPVIAPANFEQTIGSIKSSDFIRVKC